jgi:hypothetical protein
VTGGGGGGGGAGPSASCDTRKRHPVRTGGRHEWFKTQLALTEQSSWRRRRSWRWRWWYLQKQCWLHSGICTLVRPLMGNCGQMWLSMSYTPCRTRASSQFLGRSVVQVIVRERFERLHSSEDIVHTIRLAVQSSPLW